MHEIHPVVDVSMMLVARTVASLRVFQQGWRRRKRIVARSVTTDRERESEQAEKGREVKEGQEDSDEHKEAHAYAACMPWGNNSYDFSAKRRREARGARNRILTGRSARSARFPAHSQKERERDPGGE